ncbi:hypothetical protein PCYB_104220 [Plasmodium cynomolgi strain B]|uniref:Pv-fam-d protein n=1 Tax=Plasmodium cynomolgi (strain B) TaxID=1120755 RepID=K6VCZ3_PLACD|nr:hypothetical protein PCYB_104220 [Plasmodium cynomolgi strain B]GAB67072.1 hypothetical protein PCYB_104220 [Plasmodium cynomolgi strain B]
MHRKERTKSLIFLPYLYLVNMLNNTCGKPGGTNGHVYQKDAYNGRTNRLLKGKLAVEEEPKEKYKLLRKKLLEIVNENDEDFEKRFNTMLEKGGILQNISSLQQLNEKSKKSLLYDGSSQYRKSKGSLEYDTNDEDKLTSSKYYSNSEKPVNLQKFFSYFKKLNLFKIFDFFEKLKEEDIPKYYYNSYYSTTTGIANSINTKEVEQEAEKEFSDTSCFDFGHDFESIATFKDFFKHNGLKLYHSLKSVNPSEKEREPLKKELSSLKKCYDLLLKPVFTWTMNYMKKFDKLYEKSLIKVLTSEIMMDEISVKLLLKKLKNYLIVIYPVLSYSIYTILVYFFNFDHFSVASTAAMVLCALIYVSYKYIKCTNNTRYKELYEHNSTQAAESSPDVKKDDAL